MRHGAEEATVRHGAEEATVRHGAEEATVRRSRLRRWLRHRRGDERGAVIIEMAFVASLVLVPLAMGVLEFGLLWRDNLTMTSAVRAGARVGSGAGDARLSDFTVLQAVKASAAPLGRDRVDKVVIYRVTTAGGAVPAACAAAAPGAIVPTESCNIYSGDDVWDLVETDFTGTLDCGTSPDAAWCPLLRETDLSIGPDSIGVWMRVNHTWVSGLFGDAGLTLTDSAVMRLEPPEFA